MVTSPITLSQQARWALAVCAGWVVGAALVLAVAFALGPFRVNSSVVWTGVALAGLVHATVAALFVRWGFELGLWPFLGTRRRVLTVALLTVAALATVVVVRFDRLILADLTGGYAGGYRAATALGVLTGAVFEATYLVRWVRRVDAGGPAGPGPWDVLVPVTGGIGLGVVAMALFFAGGAVLRNARLDRFEATIPPIDGVHGTYFAFGDSYSAGEGLPPFDRWTAKVDADGADRCHRSSRGYPRLLRFASPAPPEVFTACSGAVIADVYEGHTQPGSDAETFVPPQSDGEVHPEAGLVTLTIGGNDLLFSRIVRFCVVEPDCLDATFGEGITGGGRLVDYPEPQPLADWIDETIDRVGERHTTLFARLRSDYPNARILAVGYPYLFPGERAGLVPSDCASVLRRVDRGERQGVRDLTDRFNEEIRRRALDAGLEFVSPVGLWAGHEPCGRAGQFTNALKPIGGDGSFHPSRSGQEALAQLVACYLGSTPGPSSGDAPLAGEPAAESLGPAPGEPGNRIACPTADP